jgi:hypothetical protein
LRLLYSGHIMVECLSIASLSSLALCLHVHSGLTNVRLDWNGFTSDKHSVSYKETKFIILALGVNVVHIQHLSFFFHSNLIFVSHAIGQSVLSLGPML